MYEILHGDCRTAMGLMDESSVDAIVTDPPYGLEFMGKAWDRGVPGVEFWTEALRVLKPGGHMLAFSGTRTYHRMVCAIEDAGFEVRDQFAWVYGSGFPKSHNGPWGGTAAKPAWEPICMARKPLIGTVEANWLAFGTGGLNIEGCRVEGGSRPLIESKSQPSLNAFGSGLNGSRHAGETSEGRWPANIIHDGSDEVLRAFPQASGAVAPVTGNEPTAHGFSGNVYGAPGTQGRQPSDRRDGGGSAARFFYCAKASKKDRDEGLADFTPTTTTDGRQKSIDNAYLRGETERKNTHPTVKPTELMRYLCRLITPAGGLVLDPFAGSGSTGKAAMLEGFRFIGCELSDEYVQIARARIAAVAPQGVEDLV